MISKTLWTVAAMSSLLLTACDSKDAGEGSKKKEKAPTAETSASSSAKAASEGSAKAGDAKKGKCEALGCKGEGTFFDMCDCKGKDMKPPLTVKFSGKYNDFRKQPEFEMTNTTDQPIHWASAAVFYYDKSGKQLEGKVNDKVYKSSRINGSTFTFKPKETTTLSFGFKKGESEPKDVDTIQAVVDGWCFGTYEDKASHLCVRIDRAPEERPKAE